MKSITFDLFYREKSNLSTKKKQLSEKNIIFNFGRKNVETKLKNKVIINNTFLILLRSKLVELEQRMGIKTLRKLGSGLILTWLKIKLSQIRKLVIFLRLNRLNIQSFKRRSGFGLLWLNSFSTVSTYFISTEYFY